MPRERKIGPPQVRGPAPRKKVYAPPKLVGYGSILKLTQSAGSGNGDTGMVMMAACL